MTAEQTIQHWQRIIAGGGLTDQDLLYAARQLQEALREQETQCNHDDSTQVSESLCTLPVVDIAPNVAPSCNRDGTEITRRPTARAAQPMF
jgi:hypothetical protein